MRRTLFVLVVLCGSALVAAAQQAKVDVCHRDEQGLYRSIRVAADAVAAHIKNHGDCVPRTTTNDSCATNCTLCTAQRCDEVLGCVLAVCDSPPNPCSGAGSCVPDTGRCFYPQLAAGEPCYPDPPDHTCDNYTCDSDAICTRRCVPESAGTSEAGSADMCMLNQSVLPASSSPARVRGSKRR
jgi:hypothetical protein